MSLVEHAKSELRRIGYTGEEPEGDPNRWMWDNVVAVVETFAAGGHSGTSASYAIGIIEKVLRFENVTPLTNDPDEWQDVSDGLWQSRRRADAFSEDAGATYYLLEDEGYPKPIHVSEHHLREEEPDE